MLTSHQHWNCLFGLPSRPVQSVCPEADILKAPYCYKERSYAEQELAALEPSLGPKVLPIGATQHEPPPVSQERCTHLRQCWEL